MATVQKRNRQARALDMLQNQLKKGTKNTKDGTTVPLTDKDTKRITKEIETLKNRI